jgi:hypothetical protein
LILREETHSTILQLPRRAKKGWREKSEREQDHSRILSDYYPHKMENSCFISDIFFLSSKKNNQYYTIAHQSHCVSK